MRHTVTHVARILDEKHLVIPIYFAKERKGMNFMLEVTL